MTKAELADEINGVMKDARDRVHAALKRENMEIGRAEDLWHLTLPDTGLTMMTHAGMKAVYRRNAVAKAFDNYLTNFNGLTAKSFVTEKEIQDCADRMTAKRREFEKIRKTDEYKTFEKLRNKFFGYAEFMK